MQSTGFKLRLAPLLFSVGLVFLSLGLITPTIGQTAQLVDRIAVIVNDRSILESDIDQRMNQLQTQFNARGATLPPKKALLPQLIERMVLESIQDQMAERFQIEVTDADINEALSNIAARENMTLDEYLEASTDGNTDDKSVSVLRNQISQELKHYKLQQRMLANRIQVTEQEVKDFLQSKEAVANQNVEYKVSHILLAVSERASPEEVQEKQDQANAIKDSINNNESSFEQVAIAVSADSFALKGGDMGYRRLSQIPTRFVKSLLTLKPGDIAKPIRSPSGFHIIQLKDKRGEEKVLVERAEIEHILIKPNQIRSEEQAEQFAIDLREYILDGKTLAELARTFSDDPGSALNGGKLGWVSLRSLDPAFAQTAREMEIDELSDVFRSQFGYHLLRVTDRKQEDMTQALMQNRAQRQLQQREFEDYLPLWFSEIRAAAYVEFKPPFNELSNQQRPGQ